MSFTQENKTDGPSSKWLIAGAVVAVAASAVAVGSYLAASSSKKKTNKSVKRQKSKKVASNESTSPVVAKQEESITTVVVEPQQSVQVSSVKTEKSVEVIEPNVEVASQVSDSAVFASVSDLLRELDQNPFSVTSNPMVQEYMNMARTSDPSEFSPSTRVLLSRFMLHCSTVTLLISLQSGQDQQSAVARSQDELNLVWSYLNFDSKLITNPVELEKYLLSKLDVSQRLNDMSSLAQVYEEIDAPNTSSDELRLAAFHISPILGRWMDFLSIGQTLISSNPTLLQSLHAMSMDRPQFPDYEVLFKLVQDKVNQNIITGNISNPTPSTAPRNFKVQTAMMKFCEVESNNADQAEQIRQSLGQNQGWQDMQLEADSATILRNGEIIQSFGFSPVQIPMIGLYNKNELKLQGYTIQEVPDQGAAVHFKEFLDLSRDTADRTLWTGSSKMIQKVIGSNSREVLEVTSFKFDIKMTLSEES